MNEQEFIQRYLSGERDFSDVDLEGICLNGSKADLLDIFPSVSSNTENSNPRIILQDLNLTGANLEEVNLTYFSLENVDLTEANIENINFRYVNLENVNLSNAQLGMKYGELNFNKTNFRCD